MLDSAIADNGLVQAPSNSRVNYHRFNPPRYRRHFLNRMQPRRGIDSTPGQIFISPRCSALLWASRVRTSRAIPSYNLLWGTSIAVVRSLRSLFTNRSSEETSSSRGGGFARVGHRRSGHPTRPLPCFAINYNKLIQFYGRG